MLIDFTKLAALIPCKGSVSFVVKHTKDGGLSVLFTSKHEVGKPDSTYEKSLDGQKKAIEAATAELNKVIPLKGTPEELNAEFENAITNALTAEKTLAETISAYVEDLNKKIKELKDKSAAKPACKPAPAAKVVEKTDKSAKAIGKKAKNTESKAKEKVPVGKTSGSVGLFEEQENASVTGAAGPEDKGTPANDKTSALVPGVAVVEVTDKSAENASSDAQEKTNLEVAA